MSDRLASQLNFIVEVDKLKEIQRRSYLVSGSRKENSAEHSWHLTVLALVLGEYANESIDVFKVLRMLVIHDMVEIDAGDFFMYDLTVTQSKADLEQKAADRIFSLLPPDQSQVFHALWQEFEARETPEAKFAAALDRLMPLIHNLKTDGRTWKDHGVTADQVYPLNAGLEKGSRTLWNWVKEELDKAVATGLLPS